MSTAVATNIHVRPLKGRDIFALTRVIQNSRGELKRLITDSRQAGGGLSIDDTELALTVLFSLISQAESEIRPWLADMAGITPEAFDELEMTQVMDLLEGIVRQEDWPAFISRLKKMLRS
jgi:hypothetical protein